MHQNEQFGPFSEQQLKRKFHHRQLYEEVMVWRDGMHGWVPATSLGNFKPAPHSNSHKVYLKDKVGYESLCIDYGGIGRFSYNAYLCLILPALVYAMMVWSPANQLVFYAGVAAIVAVSLMVCASRLQNLGYTRKANIGLLVPIYNLYLLMHMICSPTGYLQVPRHSFLEIVGKLAFWLAVFWLGLQLAAHPLVQGWIHYVPSL